MTALCNYLENKIADHVWRGVPFTAPTVLAHALILASRGYSNNNRSTPVSSGDTIVPATPNGRLYKCTTAGTTASGEPTWPTTDGATVADGTAVWTEQTTAIEAGTFTEVANAGAYTRPTLNPSTANWAATNGAGTTTNPSSGTSGTTSNNGTIAYGVPSTNWGVIYGIIQLDSATYGAGNALFWCALATPKTVNSGDEPPSFAAGSLALQLDN